jgi:cobalamin-dependent methionine synthase I
MEISNKEVMRYLGYRGAAVDERTASLVTELIDLFTANVVPKSVYGIWDCQVESSEVVMGGMTVHSQNLAQHLAGCRRAVLLAATLGAEADTLIRRFSVQDMEKAVVAQAVCAAMIEAYCDIIESELTQKPEFDGLYPTSRFSPGYGDFDIAHQKDILNMLHCSGIGLTLTEGYMLIPSKSVTAVIGFSPEEKCAAGQQAGKCERCADTQCKFREAV